MKALMAERFRKALNWGRMLGRANSKNPTMNESSGNFLMTKQGQGSGMRRITTRHTDYDSGCAECRRGGGDVDVSYGSIGDLHDEAQQA
jgi:hypothetical protein